MPGPSSVSESPTLLPGVVVDAPDGVLGFDCNRVLSDADCAAFFGRGYRFVARYVGRLQQAPNDLTHSEARRILAAGLALHVVQHVATDTPPGWRPNGPLGAVYGGTAARIARQIGIPAGVTIWCDLECVHVDTPAADVIAHANAWYASVLGAGYLPGLYVGCTPGLTARQLFYDLKFARYWGSYNINADEAPEKRGWCVKQRFGTSGNVGRLTQSEYQDDRTGADRLGGRFRWLAPTGAGAL